MTLAPIDFLIIAGYFAVVLVIGFVSSRRTQSSADFLLAGRSLTLPVFVMTLVSTWYGGILGVGEFSYRYGISNWFVQGVPYYFFALVFAMILAEKVRATNFATIPDKLQDAYDTKTAVLGAVLTFFLMTPAPYILMIGVLLQMVFGWSLVTCIVLGTLATTVYLWFGGFSSDVNTDIFEFFLMFAGFGIILPFAYQKFGGWDFIVSHVPPLHLHWNGGNSFQFVIVWFFIALWTLVDPSFHQRCYAAKSGKVARNGILVSILFWFAFDAMTATAGLYARAAIPDLTQPLLAYPRLAELTLPPIAKGLFFVGMLATIMSTLNTLAFVSATTLGRDIVWRLRGRTGDDEHENLHTRIGLIVAGGLAIVLAIAIPSVITLWYVIGTAIIPGLLIPLVTSYFPAWKAPKTYAFWSMLGGWFVATCWLVAAWSVELGSENYPLGIEPMYPGVAVSAGVWCAGWVRARKAGRTPEK